MEKSNYPLTPPPHLMQPHSHSSHSSASHQSGDSEDYYYRSAHCQHLTLTSHHLHTSHTITASYHHVTPRANNHHGRSSLLSAMLLMHSHSPLPPPLHSCSSTPPLVAEPQPNMATPEAVELVVPLILFPLSTPLSICALTVGCAVWLCGVVPSDVQ